ncbi:hypothetical protein NX801_26350 [Streptomyces sp. LP05-1]|uniref:Secreted protein n=1 Tax=Streptomyces pyxinae TaxID=2970734 RepID=A0ABT2CNU0_9ACTN|nr:hypothetical protein [Streptomyces sp. LP05-1]MCS0639101.1 hypothetical protein [Streptomyces sp. LP05-1]
MKRNALRVAGVSAIAALAFGIAAPMANATNAAPVQPVAAVRSAVAQHTGSVSLPSSDTATASAPGVPSDAQPAPAGAGKAVKAAWEAIKKSGLAKKAYEAAKKGQTGFIDWVDSLSSWNPVKWAVKALPGYMIQELISYIITHYMP